MKILKLTLITSDLDYLVSYLNDHMAFEYNYTDSNTVVFTQRLSRIFQKDIFRNVLILKKTQSNIEIEIIEEQPTGNSLLQLLYKPKSEFIKQASKTLNHFCDEFIISQKSKIETSFA